jgi:hypothetical protein
MDPREAILQRTYDLRSEAWSRWGVVDGDLVTHLINPYFSGCPRWPALREGFHVVRRGGAILVASDGLSDPYDEGAGPAAVNGLGLEVFGWSSDPIPQVPGSWLFDLVWQASQFAASRDDIASLLEQYRLLTTELYDVGIPAEHRGRFVSREGRVGVILNLTEEPIPDTIDGPLSTILLVNVKLLTLEELAFVVERGPEGRIELARHFSSPIQASSLLRASVIPEGSGSH